MANIPVITSNLGGMAELVENERNGLLFEPGEVDDLRQKIDQFIDNPYLISEFSQEMPKVRSIKQDCIALTRIYYELLNHKSEALINELRY